MITTEAIIFVTGFATLLLSLLYKMRRSMVNSICDEEYEAEQMTDEINRLRAEQKKLEQNYRDVMSRTEYLTSGVFQAVIKGRSGPKRLTFNLSTGEVIDQKTGEKMDVVEIKKRATRKKPGSGRNLVPQERKKPDS
jgi:hypothetical protein